jgi:Apea-like HEPN
VRYLVASSGPFDLGGGVSIRGRSFRELSELGFSQGVLAGLSEDWSAYGFGASSFVMTVEDRLDKSPDNFVLTSPATEFTKAQRALVALRLLAPGDIGIGRMWVSRPARFNVGLGGGHMRGYSVPVLGSDYRLTDSIAAAVPDMYEALRHLEDHGYRGAPGNLDLALRSFMATYDLPLARGDSRVLNSMTAIEAVLGSGTEIAFKLSYRVAGILGADAARRVAIFEKMKAYYDLRSKLVHGESLKEKHRRLIGDVEPLRDLVRGLLRGFIHLAITPDHSYGKRFFQERLDAALHDESERMRLRGALGMS